MPALRASWLGSWSAPWGPGRGRRWGDPVWALGAISQAWLLGGREGRWPQIEWEKGPRPRSRPREWTDLPDPAWVALLRHGSPQAEAGRRARREGELEAWCWSELLEGSAEPWWARAALLLSVQERIRWIPWIGAVDPDGALHLPPFLAQLIPDALHRLPPGWWETLLKGLDSEGNLVPDGSLPQDLPRELLHSEGKCLKPLVLEELPPPLEPYRHEPWLHALPGGAWMIDPRLRAWGRGRGLPTAPAGLAFGGPPRPEVSAILTGSIPEHPWRDAIRADLEGSPPPAPPPCGDPTLDRLRMRWTSDPASMADGYPPWGTPAHPCADPFHWMAEGRRAFLAQELAGSLRAFTLAHAHFQRLASPFWASRAAANAGYAALFWGDLQGLESWQKAAGPQPSPYDAYDRALLKACSGDWKGALPVLEKLCATHPGFKPSWVLLALHGLSSDSPERVREALPHIPVGDLECLLRAYLKGDFTDPVPALVGEERLQWEYLRARHGAGDLHAFWGAWEACSNHLLRLNTGLLLLEEHPEARSAGRLVQLQAIANRTRSETHLARLQELWPAPPHESPSPAREMLQAWLDRQEHPTWILWEGERMGSGERPPEALVSRIQQAGSAAPCDLGDRIWCSIPLEWEGARVGAALVGLPPQSPPETAQAAGMAAPWVAQLLPRKPAHPEFPPMERLLAEGSEPMASVLREMARVAPSGLPVLIQGPSGSGKELTAWELHRLSRRPGPLIAVNCAAFAESLLESELFGHVKGAFTGANRDRRGAIEQAEGGTLFLDEIADLSPRLQSLFLRVLQEKELRRVGSERVQRVDVRFVSASHRDLERMAAEGRFRADLLYRLKGTVLDLPSLEERRHEFPFLIPRLAARIATEDGRPAPALTPGLAQALARHPWPGNFRELGHALARALLRCGEGPLKPEHFPELKAPRSRRKRSWVESTQDFQRQLLRESLHQYRFQISETAEALGITRPALYAAAKRVGLDLVAEKLQWEALERP